MTPHPYVRAYMAGIAVPTFLLIFILTVYAYNRFYFEVSSQFVIPLPGAPLTLVPVATTSPRRMVMTGQPVTCQPS